MNTGSENEERLRRLGGIVLGILYGFVAWLSLNEAIGRLSRPGDKHYIALSAAWLASVGLGCVFACEVWSTRPFTAAIITALPFAAALAGVFHLANSLRALVNDLYWPPPANWEPPLILLTFVAALASGQWIKEQRDSNSEMLRRRRASAWYQAIDSGRFTVFGVRWKFWLWLWVPMFFWLGLLPLTLYLQWVNLALIWHRTLHFSLWFDSRWDFYAGLAEGLSSAALAALLIGSSNTLESVSENSDAARGKLKTFLLSGVGLAMVANVVLVMLSEWASSHLTMIGGVRPWWQVF
jgi:hypothetical protein